LQLTGKISLKLENTGLNIIKLRLQLLKSDFKRKQRKRIKIPMKISMGKEIQLKFNFFEPILKMSLHPFQFS